MTTPDDKSAQLDATLAKRLGQEVVTRVPFNTQELVGRFVQNGLRYALVLPSRWSGGGRSGSQACPQSGPNMAHGRNVGQAVPDECAPVTTRKTRQAQPDRRSTPSNDGFSDLDGS